MTEFRPQVPNGPPEIVIGQPIEIRPGRTLSIAEQEGTERLRVFLCHGAGGNKNQWRHQWQALERAQISAVAWDCYGHGNSPQPRRRLAYAGAALVDDAEAVLRRYRAERNILVAHSYGTRLLLCLLERMAARGELGAISGVMLIGPPPVVPRPVTGLMRWAPAFVLEWLRPRLAAGFQALAWHPETDPALIAAESLVTRRNSLFMMQALMQQSAAPSPAGLAAVTVRTLVLTGNHDRLTPPECGRDLAARLPDATFTLVERAGHQVMLEQPEVVTATLLKLVQDAF